MSDFARLRRTTPARLDVGRAGSRPRTTTLLQFRRDHAAACDAVWSEWPPEFVAHLGELGFEVVTSQAGSRRQYILNPPLGRRLAAGEAERIITVNRLPALTPSPSPKMGEGDLQGDLAPFVSPEREPGSADIQLVLSDGLSAIAGERHGDTVIPRLLDALGSMGRLAVPVAVRNGRVAIGDDIALVAGAVLVVHLIGERPGLATAESLGCYLTYAPSLSSTDADRKCISNIHAGGLNPAEAGVTIAGLARRILDAGTSRIDLVL
jgi:ethanolamine ammonia-lyase small subunit